MVDGADVLVFLNGHTFLWCGRRPPVQAWWVVPSGNQRLGLGDIEIDVILIKNTEKNKVWSVRRLRDWPTQLDVGLWCSKCLVLAQLFCRTLVCVFFLQNPMQHTLLQPNTLRPFKLNVMCYVFASVSDPV